MRRTLLLIHGFPQDHTLWEPQRAALAGAVNLWTPDLRGFGNEADPTFTGPIDQQVMTMDDYARDLLALIDRQGIEKVVLCGLSMGGYVAMAFWQQWPQRVEGLILCNTKSTADNEEGKVAREQTAHDAVEKGMHVIARGMLPKVLCAKTRSEDPMLVARVESMMARQEPKAVAAAARGMALRPDRTAALASVKVPTLIITGDSDELMPLPTSQAMAQTISGAELVVLPHAGHLSNLEAPKEFNAAVLGFLSRLPDAST